MKHFIVANPKQVPPGYGAHIQIETPYWDLPSDIQKRLDELSIWGGNTSNTPGEYSHWEFGAVAFYEACSFLEGIGCSVKRQFEG
jgi:hypothetical protein